MKKILSYFVDMLPIFMPIILFVGGYAISWAITMVMIKLITLCFGWTFSFGIATGIWLIMCIAKGIFSHK